MATPRWRGRLPFARRLLVGFAVCAGMVPVTVGLVPVTAWAAPGWSGQFQMRMIGLEQDMSFAGTLRSAQGKLRFDYVTPVEMAVLIDPRLGKAWTRIGPRGRWLQLDLGAPGQGVAAVPGCDEGDLGCMKRLGFKEIGKEKLGPLDTRVLERTVHNRHGSVVQRVWRVSGKKQMLARMRTLDEDGRGMQLDVTALREVEVADADLAPPKGEQPQRKPAAPAEPKVPQPLPGAKKR